MTSCWSCWKRRHVSHSSAQKNTTSSDILTLKTTWTRCIEPDGKEKYQLTFLHCAYVPDIEERKWLVYIISLHSQFNPRYWCFWAVVLEKTLESPSHCKEIQPVHSEGDQPWDFFAGNDAENWNSSTWPPHAKSWLTGKDSDAGRDWGQEEKGTTQDKMAGWHHGLDGRESEGTPGVGDGQGGLACYDSWGRKESETTERLNWTELNIK